MSVCAVHVKRENMGINYTILITFSNFEFFSKQKLLKN